MSVNKFHWNPAMFIYLHNVAYDFFDTTMTVVKVAKQTHGPQSQKYLQSSSLIERKNNWIESDILGFKSQLWHYCLSM